MSVDPEALAAAFAHFDSRGVIHGDQEFNHAATMRLWAADVWAWVRRTQAEVDAALAERDDDRARVAGLRVAVNGLIDRVDPTDPDAPARFFHALAALLDEPADGPAVPLTQLPTPRPRARVAS